jgi:hypothetical protein
MAGESGRNLRRQPCVECICGPRRPPGRRRYNCWWPAERTGPDEQPEASAAKAKFKCFIYRLIIAIIASEALSSCAYYLAPAHPHGWSVIPDCVLIGFAALPIPGSLKLHESAFCQVLTSDT